MPPFGERLSVITTNPLDNFSLNPNDIKYIGKDLQRPECILAERDGTLWSADARGGVVRIASDGTQQLVASTEQQNFSGAQGEEMRLPKIPCRTASLSPIMAIF